MACAAYTCSCLNNTYAIDLIIPLYAIIFAKATIEIIIILDLVICLNVFLKTIVMAFNLHPYSKPPKYVATIISTPEVTIQEKVYGFAPSPV